MQNYRDGDDGRPYNNPRDTYNYVRCLVYFFKQKKRTNSKSRLLLLWLSLFSFVLIAKVPILLIAGYMQVPCACLADRRIIGYSEEMEL